MNAFPRDELRLHLARLAKAGIFVGTSSWKYEGWLGLVYSPDRYLRYFKSAPPKHQKERFRRTCLAEYAETFRTVCLDAGFYQFPTPAMLEGYFSQVPSDFRLSLKVTEDITIKKFPNMPRYGKRAGQINERFLDPDLFVTSFLAPLDPYKAQIGTLFLEFSRFHADDWQRGREFVTHLDAFLDKLPRGWNYSVEVRNESLLHPRYFEVLRQHGVAHTYNSWTHMPPVSEQMRVVGSDTADFCSARFLLKPGRSYQQAVDAFTPYSVIKEPNLEARLALARLLCQKPLGRAQRRYIYVNNRLEGSAPWSIIAALQAALVSDASV